ncbi:MAG: hypothetical protein LBR16_02735 [Treponema sp.]|jgi:hypothetical protein|nr:hypothetical protein [Treponema sp.]
MNAARTALLVTALSLALACRFPGGHDNGAGGPAQVTLSVGTGAPARSVMPGAWGPADNRAGNHADKYRVVFTPAGGGTAALSLP